MNRKLIASLIVLFNLLVVTTRALTISGSGSVCAGSTIPLTPDVPGGTWSSGSTSIATVDASGIVSGVSSGTALISYTDGTTYATTTVTVNPLPGTITGLTTVCISASNILKNGSYHSNWTSSNSAIADVANDTLHGGTYETRGRVTGVTAGTATITCTLPTGCYSTIAVIVPDIWGIPIGGTAPYVCEGSPITLEHDTIGGVWMSNNPGVATVDESGVVTGQHVYGAHGGLTAEISYVKNGQCIFTIVTVYPLVAGTYPEHLCTGTSATYIADTLGGTWHSSNTSVLTIDEYTGVATGVAAGVAQVSYTLTSTAHCLHNGSISGSIFVNNPPSGISGTTNVCIGSTTTLTSSTGGGTWSSSNTDIATVGSATGVVAGITSGTATITYQVTSTGCITTTVVTVNALPAAITGTLFVYVGDTTTLGDDTTGGTWSSDNTGIATVGSATGIVTGISFGTVTITYTAASGCYTTAVVTVDVDGTSGGGSHLCVNGTITLTTGTPGGTWTSANTSVATVDATTGTVTGVAYGTATISYSLSGSYTTFVVTVSTSPSIGTQPANFAPPLHDICVGNTITLNGNRGPSADPTIIWSSSNESVAIVGTASNGSTTGNITALSDGNVTITFTPSFGCYGTYTLNVHPAPSAITGALTVCAGSTTTLSNATGGGTWMSYHTAIATVGSSSGIVTGVAAGTDTIRYRLYHPYYTGCQVFAVVTVNPLSSAITGVLNTCTGSTTNLSNSVPGGTWSSSNTGVATVNSTTGVVTGVSAGTATISYATTCGTATTTVTIYSSGGTISGFSTVCTGSAITLTEDNAGGTWSSSNTATATVNSSTGVVTGVAAGSVTITYTLGSTCTSTTIVTVISTLTTAITGVVQACVGSVTDLNDATAGGTWSSSNTSLATVDANGGVTGIASGTVTITYSLGSGCTVTKTVTVNLAAHAITTGATPAISDLCLGSSALSLNAGGSGSYSSSNTGVATVTSTGNTTPVSTGTVTITFTVSPSGCFSTRTFTVNPSVSSITGTTLLCTGSSVTLSDAAAGGTWYSGNTMVATVGSATGVVTGAATASTANIIYRLYHPTYAGCQALVVVTVNSAVATITGTTSVCVSSTITLSDGTSGGTWSSSNSNATVNSSTGVVTGASAGTSKITYATSAGCYATKTVSVNSCGGRPGMEDDKELPDMVGGTGKYTLSPNPGNGNIVITQNKPDNDISIIKVISYSGAVVHEGRLEFANGEGQLRLSNPVPGMYLVIITDGNGDTSTFKMIVQ